MQKEIHQIVIVGAGPAGLYLSIFLSQNKVPHILVDQAQELQNIGFGVLVQENFFTCLEAIGIQKNSLPFATTTRIEATRTNGKDVIDIHISDTPVYSTKRGEILRVLKERLDTKNLITGKRIDSIEKNKVGYYTLHATDGTSMYAKNIIGADGIKSVVRDNIFQKNIARKVYSALYFWIKNNEEHTMKSLMLNDVNTLTMPVSKEDAILFIVTTKSFNPKEITNEDICRELLAPGGDTTRDLLSRVFFEKNSLLTFVQRTKRFKFAKKNAALIGDAAHGETPILGWGTTIALEDAYTLGTLIVKNKENISKAFSRFYAVRKKRVGVLHAITTLEETLIGIFGEKKNRVRRLLLYLIKPFDSILYNRVRRLYKKLNSHILEV